jgi:hypothetical protein
MAFARLKSANVVATYTVHAAPGATATLILFNGRIWTENPRQREAEAVAIDGQDILAVGSSTDIRALAGPNCKTVDLQGHRVAPGSTTRTCIFSAAASRWGFAQHDLWAIGLALAVMERLEPCLVRPLASCQAEKPNKNDALVLEGARGYFLLDSSRREFADGEADCSSHMHHDDGVGALLFVVRASR